MQALVQVVSRKYAFAILRALGGSKGGLHYSDFEVPRTPQTRTQNLNALREYGLIRKVAGRRRTVYFLTPKGKMALKLLLKIERLGEAAADHNPT